MTKPERALRVAQTHRQWQQAEIGASGERGVPRGMSARGQKNARGQKKGRQSSQGRALPPTFEKPREERAYDLEVSLSARMCQSFCRRRAASRGEHASRRTSRR